MYSFPSKTIEYMSSGTPVLTTKLGGIPKEYYDYLFFTKGDSINDIYESLDDLLKVDQSVLIEKGQKAKKFVDENKNYLLQTKKVIDFVNKESC